MTASPIDPNQVLLTGEYPYIHLSENDEGPTTTKASSWQSSNLPTFTGMTALSSSFEGKTRFVAGPIEPIAPPGGSWSGASSVRGRAFQLCKIARVAGGPK